MKIYIAASSAEVSRAFSMREHLRQKGFEVSSSWVDLVQDMREMGHKDDATITHATLTMAAIQDMREVSEADVLVYVRPDDGKSEGAAFEAGYFFAMARIASKKLVSFDSTGRPPQNIFTVLMDSVNSMDALEEYLRPTM